jgi:hypothetical protein
MCPSQSRYLPDGELEKESIDSVKLWRLEFPDGGDLNEVTQRVNFEGRVGGVGGGGMINRGGGIGRT